MFRCDVAVIGGGAIGKTAALALANSGLKVTLLAQLGKVFQPEQWDARVYALNRQARSLLDSLRVWHALDASRIAPVTAMVVDGDDPANPGRLTFDAYSARTDSLAWIVEDAHLNQALDAALRFAQDVKVMPVQADALTIERDQAFVWLKGGEGIAASLVVGADGGQSWVRGRCGIDLDMRHYHQRAVVANFTCETPHHDVAYQRFAGEEGIVALLPLPGDRVSLVWSAPNALAEALMAMPFNQLAQRVAAVVGHRLGRLVPLQPELRHAFPLTMLRSHSMTSARVALAGDAAHVIHPLAGQGMNLGFADVQALVNAVNARGQHRDCGDARVLGRYGRARKEDVLMMQAATDGLARLFGTNAGPLQAVRNLGLNLFDRLPFLKRQMMIRALGSPNETF